MSFSCTPPGSVTVTAPPVRFVFVADPTKVIAIFTLLINRIVEMNFYEMHGGHRDSV
jgi:hypothetical protein